MSDETNYETLLKRQADYTGLDKHFGNVQYDLQAQRLY